MFLFCILTSKFFINPGHLFLTLRLATADFLSSSTHHRKYFVYSVCISTDPSDTENVGATSNGTLEV